MEKEKNEKEIKKKQRNEEKMKQEENIHKVLDKKSQSYLRQ